MRSMTFVVVDYNNSTYTRCLCESLRHQVGFGIDFELRVLIVNNSIDSRQTETLYSYCDEFPWIRIVDCPDNPGYFGGLNRGLETLSGDSKKWVVIGNNDLEFDMNFVRTIFGKEYSQSISVLCPDVITKNGLHQNPHVLNRISTFQRFQYDMYYSHYYVACLLKRIKYLIQGKNHQKNKLKEGEIHMGIGACYVLTPRFFQHFEKLNYPFFLYGEEAFISQQIHDVGGLVWFDPSLKVLHAESATLNRMPNRTIYDLNRKGYPVYRRLL